MARTLSRIAQFGILLATAAMAWPAMPRAWAQSGVQVGSTSETIQNPFTTHGVDPQPTTAPTVDSSGPRMYQNPFSTSAGLMPAAAPPSRGTLARWRRPTPAPNGSIANPFSPAAATPSSPSTSPPPAANSSWDILSPSQLEEARYKTAPQPVEAASEGVTAPPDPAAYGSGELQQPGWLVPAATSTEESQQPKQLPYPTAPLNVRTPPGMTEDGRIRPLPVPTSAPSFGMRQPDPFDAPDGVESVVSDRAPASSTSQARPIAPRSIQPPADAVPAKKPQSFVPPTAAAPPLAPPADCYEHAQRVAESAQSLDELTQVAQLCQQGLAGHPPRDLAGRLRSLAAWARNRHGELQSDAGKDTESLADFNTALEFDPNCWLALHNRAVSFAQQGHGNDALRDFNRVIQLNPGMAIAYRNRGELLASMGRTEEAVADYGQAIAQLPQEADLYEIRGHALHRLGRYKDALADLDRAIKLAPRDANTFVHRGNVYAELGNYELATDDFQHAIELDANCADAYRSLAWLQSTCPDERFRDSKQAVIDAERAAKLSAAGNCFVLEALAAAHANAGDFEAAVHYQKLAMSVAPKSFEPQFSERLAMYERQRPYRNEIATAPVDRQVRAASLEAPPAPAAAQSR
jgi:tetratricopeptide (TPR) repeat protein